MVKKNKFLDSIEFKENKGYLAKITGADVDLGHLGVMGAGGAIIGHQAIGLKKMLQQKKAGLRLNPKNAKGKVLAAAIGGRTGSR